MGTTYRILSGPFWKSVYRIHFRYLGIRPGPSGSPGPEDKNPQVLPSPVVRPGRYCMLLFLFRLFHSEPFSVKNTEPWYHITRVPLMFRKFNYNLILLILLIILFYNHILLMTFFPTCDGCVYNKLFFSVPCTDNVIPVRTIFFFNLSLIVLHTTVTIYAGRARTIRSRSGGWGTRDVRNEYCYYYRALGTCSSTE